MGKKVNINGIKMRCRWEGRKLRFERLPAVRARKFRRQGIKDGTISGTGECVKYFAEEQLAVLESIIDRTVMKFHRLYMAPFVEYNALSQTGESINGRIRRVCTPNPHIETADSYRGRIYYVQDYIEALYQTRDAIEVRKVEIMSWLMAFASLVNRMSECVMKICLARVNAYCRGVIAAGMSPDTLPAPDVFSDQFRKVVDAAKIIVEYEETHTATANNEGGKSYVLKRI